MNILELALTLPPCPLLLQRNFLKQISENVAQQSQFFISYVIVTGGIQIFFRLSQVHNVLVFWFQHKGLREKAISQRRLDTMRTKIKIFHLDEFIPLFFFIFIVGESLRVTYTIESAVRPASISLIISPPCFVGNLYGPLAPLASQFVALFFLCSYKVFKYMALFVYGSTSESGGSLFYILTTILLFVVYMNILVISGYLSLNGSNQMAAVFLIVMIVVTAVLHQLIQTIFVKPSMTLSLEKARLSDEANDTRTAMERKLERYSEAKREFQRAKDEESSDECLLSKLLTHAIDPMKGGDEQTSTSLPCEEGDGDSKRREAARTTISRR